ncbi:hydrophobin-251 [Neolentinus lepideus HHB14362 ss-1]|uniref:Hydrophobin n=1 Tax=Neolentinus lepideus HHB14362 ss-1 TaxID=1314782 RepID=A0A165VV88_9AGAM|nr:hydrophobin-251 [Neolentinus lepideus HHB14362 ss-1]
MFSFTKFAAIAAVVILAVATPTPQTLGSCNTGSLQCCNSIQKASDLDTSTLLGLGDIVLPDINAMVGLDCSPITAIGLGGRATDAVCNSARPACCEDNSQNSLVSLGCVPVSL